MGKNYLRNYQQSGRSHTENTFTKTYKEPFRISDSILVVGKYKGKRLTTIHNLPYLRWMYDNVTMSTQHKSILRNHIDYTKRIVG